jgi:hypothetical protein
VLLVSPVATIPGPGWQNGWQTGPDGRTFPYMEPVSAREVAAAVVTAFRALAALLDALLRAYMARMHRLAEAANRATAMLRDAV